MSIQISSYKGNPTISLAADSKWPFTFGVAKAKLILENLDAIRAFVASQPASKPTTGPMTTATQPQPVTQGQL